MFFVSSVLLCFFFFFYLSFIFFFFFFFSSRRRHTRLVSDWSSDVCSSDLVAILTKQHNGRAACHYCGPCEQGCVTFSYYSSPWTTIAAAQKTGRLTLMTDRKSVV